MAFETSGPGEVPHPASTPVAMPDSIYVPNLPAGYTAYLGYADGKWPTAAELRKTFPAAHIISLTVFGTTDADGVDIEPGGNANAAEGVAWVAGKLDRAPSSRPVIYASMAGTPGYGMPWVLDELAKRNIPVSSVRLHAAHYTYHAHICSPACGASFTADATQWTDRYPGNNGTLIDMSSCNPSYFTPASPPEDIMQVPGIPGNWLAPPVTWVTVDGTAHAVGADPDNKALWIVTRPAGGSWSGTRKIS